MQVGEIPASVNEINGCASEAPTPLTEEEFALLFADDCSNVVVSLFSSSVGNNCGWSIIHIYTVADDCGNVLGDFKVYYSGEDLDAPELAGVPADMMITCEEEAPEVAVVTATDDCDADVEINFEETIEEGNCAGNYNIIRTWTAVDDCGNSVSASQTIEVRDLDEPVLVGKLPVGSNKNDMCAPDTDDELDALGVLTEAEFALLYVDNCSGVSVTRVINLDGDDCKWIMWVRYDVADNCGNEAQSVKLWYHGADLTAPVIECPADMDFGFEQPVFAEEAAYTDACAGNGVTTEYTDDTSVEGQLIRTFTASDGCNESTCSVTYTWSVEESSPTQAAPDQDAKGVELDFKTYPVPFDSSVNVKFNFEFDTDITVEVHDTKGLLVKSMTINGVKRGSEVSRKLDLSRGADQLFYITVTTNQGSVTKKVVSSNIKRR